MNKQILKYVPTYYYLENRPILSLIKCDFVGKIAFLCPNTPTFYNFKFQQLSYICLPNQSKSIAILWIICDHRRNEIKCNIYPITKIIIYVGKDKCDR